MARVMGPISMSANGETYLVKSAVEVKDSVGIRTAIVGKDGLIHGYAEGDYAGSITTTITARPGQDLRALFELTGGTATVTMPGINKTVIVTDATYTGAATLNSDEAEVPFMLTGQIEWIDGV